jgi:hypothetical protein
LKPHRSDGHIIARPSVTQAPAAIWSRITACYDSRVREVFRLEDFSTGGELS